MACCLLFLPSVINAQPKSRDTLVRDDLKLVSGIDRWIYNDLPKAVAKAKATGKPLLVVLRCIPCEACAQLDADIVSRDSKAQNLLSKFVCVRLVQCNGLDLALFQYDYDQSFAAFFMNADKTIYGRYGTRSHQTESADDVSLAGFSRAMVAALALHRGYPGNRAALAGKQPQQKPAYPTPEQYPPLKDRYTSKLNYKGQVAKSCIHCHQVGEVLRSVYRDNGKAIPQQLLYPYPNPSITGLVMDPEHIATVKQVKPGSAAASSGFQQGDEIVSLKGQPVLSTADLQWVLHHTGAEAKLPAEVQRGGKQLTLQLSLADGWRNSDISWRATTWSLRRMALGGLKLELATPEQRAAAGAKEGGLALLIKRAGRYGPHALARRTGFREGDVIIEVDGRTSHMTESDLLTWLVNRRTGEKVPFRVHRAGKNGGRKITYQLPMQK